MTKRLSSTLHGGQQRQSAPSFARWILLLSIGFGVLGLFWMNSGAIKVLSCEYGMDEFEINLPQTQQETFIESTLHDGVTNSASEAWEVAIHQAKNMLALSNLNSAECLVPDTKRTKELVRKLIEEDPTQRKVSGYQPFVGAPKDRTFEVPLVPLPILNVGMPKLGSTTLHFYFMCKGFSSTHWDLKTSEFEGLCMRDAVRIGLPPLSTCSNGTHSHMQMDVALPMGSQYSGQRPGHRSSVGRDDCFFPQLSILEEIHAEAPHATLVLTFRPMYDWTKSMTGWYTMMERLSQCHLPNLPRGIPDLSDEPERDEYEKKRMNHTESLEATMTQFFCSHVLHVRNFVKKYPTHTLLELDLYDDQTPKILDELFPSSNDEITTSSDNATKSCWDQYKGGFGSNEKNGSNKKDLQRQRSQRQKKKMKMQRRNER